MTNAKSTNTGSPKFCFVSLHKTSGGCPGTLAAIPAWALRKPARRMQHIVCCRRKNDRRN
ncbi:MAG: hypothetical protein GF353_15665 [Candidatus Lokiarchaeota archaeon]|nr:hypothetical protein [Candidatus Lokiarchaeota archaeon]